MVAVAIAAVDFGALRAGIESGSSEEELLLVGALPMANVLAIGLVISLRRPGTRPFLLGFEVFGALALAVCVVLASYFPDDTIIPYVGLFFNHVWIGAGMPRAVYVAIVCAVSVIVLGSPQLGFAVTGGLLSRRYRVTITRRSSPPPADSGTR
jgi:hypothetical protein